MIATRGKLKHAHVAAVQNEAAITPTWYVRNDRGHGDVADGIDVVLGLPQELVRESGEWLGVAGGGRRTKSYWWSGGFAASRPGASKRRRSPQ